MSRGRAPGTLSAELKGKMKAGRVRAKHRRKQRSVEMAAAKRRNDHSQAEYSGHISVSPAVWRSQYADIGDYHYVDGDLDEIELRALHDRVVYADRMGYHEPALQEITIELLAAVERDARKNGRKRRTGLPAPPPRTEPVRVRKIAAPKVPVTRTGSPLTAVVAEMFPETREGRPLLQVVSSLFDS